MTSDSHLHHHHHHHVPPRVSSSTSSPPPPPSSLHHHHLAPLIGKSQDDLLSAGGGEVEDSVDSAFVVGADLTQHDWTVGSNDNVDDDLESNHQQHQQQQLGEDGRARTVGITSLNRVGSKDSGGSGTLLLSSSTTTDLRAIRLNAKRERIRLEDTVAALSRSMTKVAAAGDKVSGSHDDGYTPEQEYLRVFDAEKVSVTLVYYVWRLVNALNQSKEPVLFRDDGSSVDLHVVSTNNGNNNNATTTTTTTAVDEPSPSSYDDSAMGRGLRCLLLALVYIDRMTKNCSTFRLTSKNAHRVVLGCMYAALKFSDDSPGSLFQFSIYGGLSMAELKRIEAAVCQAVNFTFYVTEAEFKAHCLMHLNLAVRGAGSRKRKERRKQRAAALSAGDSVLSEPYGLGGSTPAVSGNSTRKRMPKGGT